MLLIRLEALDLFLVGMIWRFFCVKLALAILYSLSNISAVTAELKSMLTEKFNHMHCEKKYIL